MKTIPVIVINLLSLITWQSPQKSDPAKEALAVGDLVTVRGRSGFSVDDHFSHYGLNSFHVMKNAARMKIVNAASTLELDGCEPESKAKG